MDPPVAEGSDWGRNHPPATSSDDSDIADEYYQDFSTITPRFELSAGRAGPSSTHSSQLAAHSHSHSRSNRTANRAARLRADAHQWSKSGHSTFRKCCAIDPLTGTSSHAHGSVSSGEATSPVDKTGAVGKLKSRGRSAATHSHSVGAGRSTRGKALQGKGKVAKTESETMPLDPAFHLPTVPAAETDQGEAPDPGKVRLLEEENEGLKRRLAAWEAVYALEMDDPAKFSQWRTRVLKAQNLQLEQQLAITTASAKVAAEVKAELTTTVHDFQHKVGELKAADRIPEPAPAPPPAPKPASKPEATRGPSASPASPATPPRKPLSSPRTPRLASPSAQGAASSTKSVTGVSSRASPQTKTTSPKLSSKSWVAPSPQPQGASSSGRPGTTASPRLATRTATSASRGVVTPGSSSPSGSRGARARTLVQASPEPTSPKPVLPEPDPSPALPPEPPPPPPVPKVAVAVDWLEHLDQWSKRTLEKLSKSPAELAKGESATGGTTGTEGESVSAGVHLVDLGLPILPAASNPFVLRRGGGEAEALEVRAASAVQPRQESSAAVNIARVHELEGQLAELHPQLLRAAGLLHSLVLPSLPAETTEALQQEMEGVDSATYLAAKALGQLELLVMGGTDLARSESATSAHAAALLEGRRQGAMQSDGLTAVANGEAAGGSGRNGVMGVGTRNGTEKNEREDQDASSALSALEGLVASWPASKTEAGEEEARQNLQALLLRFRRLETLWRNEKRALTDEMDFYRGCHAANAMHLKQVMQAGRDALSAVITEALEATGAAGAAIQKVLGVLESLEHQEGEAGGEAFRQLQEAAPALQHFVDLLPEALRGPAQPKRGEAAQSAAAARTTAVIDPLEQAYKDRLKVLFSSLQSKRVEAYRQRSLSSSTSRR